MQYDIKGGNLPVVICQLESGEQMITENGGMAWMSPNMSMDTTTNGGLGKAFGRMFSGEKMFQNIYTANGKGMIAFASSFPGSIMAFHIEPGREMILQKKAFLASETSVTTEICFQKKLGAGFFGGEGFILQRCSGRGVVFAEFDGSVITYDLAPGQQIVVDTGYVAAMEATCSLDIQQVKGAKNILFGGEGLFNTIVTGPGKVYLQTIPLHQVANVLRPYFPTPSK
ncbi:MAG: TIGR00266 family protein [Lachnospiraceae bacterium]|nr:TIGR00266 family protein [Lachnospiraceae bacterium]